jgi:hypothetical protein
MNDEIQKSMINFIAEAKMIYGAENAIFELSEEVENCLILTGEIYGKDTNHKINKLGRERGLLILAHNLSILYERPKH